MTRPPTPIHELPTGLPETPVDRAAAAVRDEEIPREVVQAATERVWARLAREAAPAGSEAAQLETASLPSSHQRPIESCDDYQALLPAFLAGELSEARALLVEGHTRHCLVCRKALLAARTETHSDAGRDTAAPLVGSTPVATTDSRRSHRSRSARPYLALAATVALLVITGGLLLLTGAVSFGPPPEMARIASIEGTLLRPADESLRLAPGTVLREGERIRTAKDSGAVLTLTDGTRIEMSERAELSLDRGFRGTTIRMDGGRIIVEAAKQEKGRLYVATDDCLVSVVGTVFSVNSGLKGSRVSVLEGEVRVARGGSTDVLLPGDQVTTDPMLGLVPLAREISWSRDSERYRALLTELEELRRELARRVPRPELRYTSELLPRVPAGTVGYLAAPNLSETLDTAYRLVQEQLAKSPQMRQIWQELVVEPGLETHIESMITQMHDLGSYLGDEVVVALARDEELDSGGPVILARVVRSGFDAYLAGEIERINAEAGHEVLTLWSPGTAPGQGLQLWTDGDFLLASPNLRLLTESIDAVASGTSGFVGAAFHQRLENAYTEGVEWLLAGDVASLMAAKAEDLPDGARKAGMENLRHILIERRSLGDHTETGIQVAFDGPRRGVFSWLAEPGPMRSLDFVAPEAPLVLGLVTKDPADMLGDLADIASGVTGAASHALPSGLNHFQEVLGVDLEDDVAATLGGEMAFAIDGPLLQGIPWKLVLEVYDSNGLQQALERLANDHDAQLDDRHVGITSETVGSRTFYTLRIDEAEVHYTYSNGFLVAAPSRLLVERALDLADAGTGLTISEDFRAMLPADGEANFSAFFYQDTRRLTEVLGDLGVQQLPATLAFAYGREDSLEAALVTPGDPLGLDYLLRMLFHVGAVHSDFMDTPDAMQNAVTQGPVS